MSKTPGATRETLLKQVEAGVRSPQGLSWTLQGHFGEADPAASLGTLIRIAGSILSVSESDDEMLEHPLPIRPEAIPKIDETISPIMESLRHAIIARDPLPFEALAKAIRAERKTNANRRLPEDLLALFLESQKGPVNCSALARKLVANRKHTHGNSMPAGALMTETKWSEIKACERRLRRYAQRYGIPGNGLGRPNDEDK
jgi:hypothetical protein